MNGTVVGETRPRVYKIQKREVSKLSWCECSKMCSKCSKYHLPCNEKRFGTASRSFLAPTIAVGLFSVVLIREGQSHLRL